MEKLPSNKKIQNAWAFYDWANSVHSLTITSAIFPIYYPFAAVNDSGSKEIDFTNYLFYRKTVSKLNESFCRIIRHGVFVCRLQFTYSAFAG